jgi:hypothetical protein
MKKCSKCGEEKDESEFHKQRNGLRPVCKSCRKLEYKNVKEQNMYKQINVSKKRCNTCGEIKNSSEFHKRCNSKDGLCPRCKLCRKKYDDKYVDYNKQYYKIYNQTHKSYRKEYNKKYFQENKERESERCKKWRQSPKGKMLRMLWYAKRRKHFGFKPFNTVFEGAQFHHLHLNGNPDLGIFFPSELHRSINHNSYTGKGMNEINKAALLWLCDQSEIVPFVLLKN